MISEMDALDIVQELKLQLGLCKKKGNSVSCVWSSSKMNVADSVFRLHYFAKGANIDLGSDDSLVVSWHSSTTVSEKSTYSNCQTYFILGRNGGASLGKSGGSLGRNERKTKVSSVRDSTYSVTCVRHGTRRWEMLELQDVVLNLL